MSECIKTGCHVYLTEYGLWARGDAYQMRVEIDGAWDWVLFFRLSGTDNRPMQDVYHFTITTIEHDFDRPTTKSPFKQPWTVIARHVLNHGYEGVPVYREP